MSKRIADESTRQRAYHGRAPKRACAVDGIAIPIGALAWQLATSEGADRTRQHYLWLCAEHGRSIERVLRRLGAGHVEP